MRQLRLSDSVRLEAAAKIADDRKVSPAVCALVVPGSSQVKLAAEAAGLDKVFKDAGFEWRESGCSMCCAINDDLVEPGQRAIATSNRNFENRQAVDAGSRRRDQHRGGRAPRSREIPLRSCRPDRGKRFQLAERDELSDGI